MNLMTFKSIDQNQKTTTILAISFCAIVAVAFSVCFIHMANKVKEASKEALVLDTKGQAYNVIPVPASDMRLFEYEYHVKLFVTKWYAFDENSYAENIQAALYLIGNKGKDLLNEYKSLDMANSLIQKNIRYGVTIKDIQVNMKTLPVSGSITFTQTGYRAGGSSARDVTADFTLTDVSRSNDNVNGVKIEDWVVHYSAPRDLTSEDTRAINK